MIYSVRKSFPTNTWSTEDIRQLRQLAVAGASLDTIALTLRRTRSAIRNKATMHGISLKRCGDSMPSEAVSA
ncbi:MAG TPA: hypothetical protein VGD45_21665 [Steroidobacter sp.]|jgi:hypothetical protein|uniref:hypothetical protein n=1 Tax=Steroidobacter sp. TaxID=1978227 RepID=UPI002ED8C16F